MAKQWTEAEDRLLKEKSLSLNDRELSELMDGRTPKAIKKRRETLCIRNVRSPASSNSKWTEEEDNFVISNYGKMSYEDMAKLLVGRTPTAVEMRKGILKSRIPSSKARQSSGLLWTEEEDTFIQANFDTLTYREMSKQLSGRTPHAIQMRVNTLGFDRNINEARRKNRIYTFDRNFFSIPNITNCYFAGFIAADGSINQSSSKVGIRISDKDEDLLVSFKGVTKYQGIIGSYTGQGKYRYRTYKDIGVSGAREWVSDLNKHFNITPHKTLTLMPPNICEESLVKSFISGFLDGDGHITSRTDSKGGRWRLGFVGTFAMLSWIKKWFDIWEPFSQRSLSVVRGPYTGKVYYYSVSGKRALGLIQKLLEVETPFRLWRKWQPVIDHLNNHPSPSV